MAGSGYIRVVRVLLVTKIIGTRLYTRPSVVGVAHIAVGVSLWLLHLCTTTVLHRNLGSNG